MHPVACAALPADPDLPVTRSALVWARRAERHPDHAWLRRQIAECARSLGDGPAPDIEQSTGSSVTENYRENAHRLQT